MINIYKRSHPIHFIIVRISLNTSQTLLNLLIYFSRSQTLVEIAFNCHILNLYLNHLINMLTNQKLKNATKVCVRMCVLIFLTPFHTNLRLYFIQIKQNAFLW